MRSVILILLASVAVAGCRPSVDRRDSQEAIAESGVPGAGASRRNGDPVAKGAENVNLESLPANAVIAEAPADNLAETVNALEGARSEPPGSRPPGLAIPAQYRGRWGMVPADCEPGRSDAKGLLTIGDMTLRFYESVGTLQEQRPAIATSFAGRYSFTGEGQSWERVVTLTREGNRLTRADEEGRYTYTRCA